MGRETEIRSFISKEKFDELLIFFNNNASFVKKDYQETFYFDCDADLRIQRNNLCSKVILKKGIIHDEHREELEISFGRDEFEIIERLFLALGYGISIKWFRERNEFIWDDDITVCLDYTRGYGQIIELEKRKIEDSEEKDLEYLKQKLSILNLDASSREEFDRRYNHYKDNWKTLVAVPDASEDHQ